MYWYILCCGRGGIGRHATLRALSSKGGESSSLFGRTIDYGAGSRLYYITNFRYKKK